MHNRLTAQPLISVIVPIYNCEKYITRCLNSIIQNSYTNLEIICINDGSSDNSLSILNSFANQDSRIQIVSVLNGGVSRARNIGLSIITGDLVAFIDSDDWIHKQYFEILLEAQQKYKSGITACGYYRLCDYLDDAREISIETAINGQVYIGKELLDNYNLKSYVWGRLFLKELIQNLYFVECLAIAEDKEFNIQIISSNPNIRAVEINCKLYYYFYNKYSAVNTCSGLDFLELTEIYLNHVNESDNKYMAEIYLQESFINSFACRYLTMFIPDPSIKSKTNGYVKQCLSFEKQLKPFSHQKSMKYKLLAYVPIIYRLYRIITDPTMREWEKNQRKRYKYFLL